MSSRRQHNVRLRVGKTTIERWTSYQISSDMLTPADAFNITLPRATFEAWTLCAPDSPVQVFIDDTLVMTGFVDERKVAGSRQGGTGLTVTGRDKGGRLVDESMPLSSFYGLSIKQLAEKVIGIGEDAPPWFDRVILSNATNRRLLRGDDAYIAGVSSEPAIDQGKHARVKVNPGQTRWQVLAQFLEEAELMAWSTADGTALVVGLPNYSQAPQYRFFIPGENSQRKQEGNVLSWELLDSVAERYSEIVACGASRGNKTDYSEAVTGRRGIIANGPGAHGIGRDFQQRKTLLVADDDVRDADLAIVRARREMAFRDGTGRKLQLTVQGHAQLHDRAHGPTLYATDTLAEVEIEELLLGQPTWLIRDLAAKAPWFFRQDPWLITSVTFGHSSGDGETTTLSLVPKGTVLRMS